MIEYFINLEVEEKVINKSSFLKSGHFLYSIPSYALESTVISGLQLKEIRDSFKEFDIDLAEILPTSPANLYRQFKKKDINLTFKDSLVSLMRLMRKGKNAFENEEDFKDWLTSKVENLANRSPIDFLHLENGLREVEEAIDRIE